jgi:hypothetical protein
MKTRIQYLTFILGTLFILSVTGCKKDVVEEPIPEEPVALVDYREQYVGDYDCEFYYWYGDISGNVYDTTYSYIATVSLVDDNSLYLSVPNGQLKKLTVDPDGTLRLCENYGFINDTSFYYTYTDETCAIGPNGWDWIRTYTATKL